MFSGIDRRQAGALFVALGLLLISLGLLAQRRPAAAGEPALRLHVLANSDSAADQALKLRVRDTLLRRIAPVLAGAPDAATMAVRLQAHLGELTRAAQAELRAARSDYPVELELGRFAFDARQLGTAVEAPGEYPALRVLIGAGAGHNWWCLLFPPLCFAGGSVVTPLLEVPEAPVAAGSAGGRRLASAAPVLLDDSDLAPQARSALLDWLGKHGVRFERLGRRLRLWLGSAAGRNPSESGA